MEKISSPHVKPTENLLGTGMSENVMYGSANPIIIFLKEVCVFDEKDP